MSITQSRIAELSGVSKSTVSRILSGKKSSHKYKKETVDKVKDIARKYNYQPNLLARSFFLQRTETLGLIITDITNPFWATISYFIENIAQKHNYNLIQCNTNDKQENEIKYINLLLNKKVDGLIICPVQKESEHFKELLKINYPFVLIDRYFENLDTDYVITDNINGTYKAIKYLISIGHERIAYLGGLPIASSNIDRLKGYKKGLQDSNIEIDESLIYQKDFSQTTGYYYVKLIFNNLSQKPTAIFSANNMITIGALMALNELSIKIPQDLSFVMFDDLIDTMNLWKIPITTVSVSREKLAEEAFNILYRKLTKNQSDYKRHIIIQPDLILRKSCKSI